MALHWAHSSLSTSVLYLGTHHCTQHSQYSLTGHQWKEIIISIDLLVTVLWMQLSVPFALLLPGHTAGWRLAYCSPGLPGRFQLSGSPAGQSPACWQEVSASQLQDLALHDHIVHLLERSQRLCKFSILTFEVSFQSKCKTYHNDCDLVKLAVSGPSGQQNNSSARPAVTV